MTARIFTAAEASALLNTAISGEWVRHHELGWAFALTGGVRRAIVIDGAEVDVITAAPDLAHTVVAQATEIERLRAIVNGRTTSPTSEEIEAHHRAGGTWYVASTHGRALTTTKGDAIALCAHLAANGYPATWWAIDTRRRPCAWPVLAEASR